MHSSVGRLKASLSGPWWQRQGLSCPHYSNSLLFPQEASSKTISNPSQTATIWRQPGPWKKVIIAPSCLITTKFVGQIHIYLFITKDSSYFHSSPLVCLLGWHLFSDLTRKKETRGGSSVKHQWQRFVTALKGPAIGSQEGESAQVFYSSSGKFFSGLKVEQTWKLQLRREATEGCDGSRAQQWKTELGNKEAGERERNKQRHELRSSVAKDVTQVERWNLKYRNWNGDKWRDGEEQQESSCPWTMFTKSCTDFHHSPGLQQLYHKTASKNASHYTYQ